jgi:hypothetical protein
MLHLATAASPATIFMLLVCLLGVGFMVRFLVALSVDEKTMRSRYVVHTGGVHYAADMGRSQAWYRDAVTNSAAHLAIGIVRITTALTSNTGRKKTHASTDRIQVAPLGRSSRELDFTAERRYRSG